MCEHKLCIQVEKSEKMGLSSGISNKIEQVERNSDFNREAKKLTSATDKLHHQ